MEHIIVIGGKAEAGKDSSAKFMKAYLEGEKGKKVLILHYADRLKSICRTYFGWDGNKDEAGRTLLQQIGTDKIRARNEDFWVSSVAELIRVLAPDYDFFLIPDFRFPGEYTYLYDENFPVVSLQIQRPGHISKLTPAQLAHPSETALDNFTFDYVIRSGQGLDHLKNEAIKFANSLIGEALSSL